MEVNMYKIYIVEDNTAIASSLQTQLQNWQMDTKCVDNFQNIIKEFVDYAPQLVLLDIGLPFFNGFHWCTEIRKLSPVPVIFLSSVSDNMNIVMAMNMGADDFIAKPFDIQVLIAKIQALLRRTYDFSCAGNLLQHKGAVLNTDDATLIYNNEKVELTKNEYRIMQVLMLNKGKTVKRDTLMTKLWEDDSFVDENTLSVNITRIRKKLESIGLNNFITTKKGIGYLVE